MKSIERLDTKNVNNKDKKGKKNSAEKSHTVIWFLEAYPSPVRKTEQVHSGEANEVFVAAQTIITGIPEKIDIGSNCNISPSKILQKVKRAEGSKQAPPNKRKTWGGKRSVSGRPKKKQKKSPSKQSL